METNEEERRPPEEVEDEDFPVGETLTVESFDLGISADDLVNCMSTTPSDDDRTEEDKWRYDHDDSKQVEKITILTCQPLTKVTYEVTPGVF